MITRRTFLKGAVAFAFVAVMPWPKAKGEDLPLLHGDGINDDAPALNALIRSEPVVVDGQVVQDWQDLLIEHGLFALAACLIVDGPELLEPVAL